MHDRVARASRRRKWSRLLSWIALAGITLVLAGNLWIAVRSAGRIFTDVREVPANNVALVLGTSGRLRGGYANPFFVGRIAAAAELYHAGKARHFLLSGDNHKADYDEPTNMRDALAEKGVPVTAMTLDYAGFRTLDSVARAKEVFGTDRLTIVTDDFHAPRSVLLARHYGIDAQVFCSQPVLLRWSKKTRLREVGARGKALLDLYLLRTQPRFFGPRIQLPQS